MARMADFEEMLKTSRSMLGHADSDMDKMAALLYATPCIQSELNDSKSLALLFKAIGSSFLRKMLSGHLDVSVDDDSIHVYRTTALNIMTSFCVNPDIAKHKNVLKMIPHVFELLRNAKETDEILESAIQFFKCIIQHDEGRQALLSHNAIKHFAWMYTHLKSDDTLNFIEILLKSGGVELESSSLNLLLTSLAEDFSKNQTQQKFTICHHLLQIVSLRKNTDSAIRTQKWPQMVLKGLKDVLTSRIDDKQRVPALKLASAMVDCYGMDWAVEDTVQEQTTSPPQRQFQLLLVHLSSIECRMQMEDQSITSILKNADLIIACFAILEKAVEDLLGENIEMREKGQIVQSYSDAAAAVMSSIAAISAFEETVEQHKIFIYAMIEFLCSGFAHDVLTSDAEAYKYVPFIMKVARNSFKEYEKWYYENQEVLKSKNDAPVDLFEFLIPALQHFAAREDGQKVIIDQIDIILDHVDFSWKVVEPAARESAKLSDCARSSLSLLVKITELMTDAILVKPEAIKGVSQFPELFLKITKMLPILENSSVFNSLLSTASILGLILIKHDVTTFEEEDARVVTVLKGSGRFLKTYKNKIPSTEAAVFQVGDNTHFWVNIREMWLLGVHLLGTLRHAMPWIESHIDPDLMSDIEQE